LPLAQDDVVRRGHAIEARLYAEDARNGFLPATGVIRAVRFPEQGIRVDRGVGVGEVITPHYDALMAKLIAHGADRAQALTTLRAARPGVSVLGVETNLSFLGTLLAHPSVVAGALDTALIEREFAALTAPEESAPDLAFALAGYLKLLQYRRGPATDPWTALATFTGWRPGRAERAPTRKPSFEVRIGEQVREVAFSAIDGEGYVAVRIGEESLRLKVEESGGGVYHVATGARALTVTALVDGDAVFLDGPMGQATARVSLYAAGTAAESAAGEGRVLAPVMGQVTKVNIEVGDRVSAGDILMVQESMKMELRLTAPCDGVVEKIACAEGDMIERHSVVAEVRPDQATLVQP
ncbi:MAG: biotin/lipoyl-containing protein, partial [Alphaproteobacteria bacterium]